ncbi:MAG: IS200/IS605 family transposase [Candidatus Marinimicrobia bacterium]|jgi:putative transposase|nr:IS200/IS605 family transposase [Candidatus Neomarinimicrobiota bacterium]
MKDWRSLAHTKWECKYHVVFVPKYRQKVLYGKRRRRVGEILRELCRQKGIELLEGHAMVDHIHLCVSIPPKFAVAMAIGYLKGKSAIRIHRELLGRNKGFANLHFWVRGYCVSTVGLDEEAIREYIRNQEKLDRGQQGNLHFGDDVDL